MNRTMAGLLSLLLLTAVLPAAAQTLLSESAVSAGGVDMASGTVRLRGTLSQAAIGQPAGGAYAMTVGFWHNIPYLVAVEQVLPEIPWDLQGACPNPFNPRTTISYSLPSAGHVALRIYNVQGELVRTLWDGDITAGLHAIPWDGRDDRGAGAASGVYIARIVSKHGVLTGKMVLTR